jgi:hypothetical protein
VRGLIKAPTFLSFLSSQLCVRSVCTSGHWVWVLLPRCSLRCTPPLGWRRTLCCFLARYLVVKEPTPPGDTAQTGCGHLAIVRIGLFPKVPLSLRCSRTRLLLRQQHATARRGSGPVTLAAAFG